MSSVRLADSRDEIALLGLCQMMHDEQGAHPIDWPKTSAMIRLATQRKRGIIGVIGEHNDIKAATFLMIEQPWYSENWFLMEYFCFVRQDSRKSSYAKDLISYAKQCSEDLGLDLMIGIFSNIRTEAKIRLYKRMLPCVGAFFLYRPERRSMEMMNLVGREPANMVPAE